MTVMVDGGKEARGLKTTGKKAKEGKENGSPDIQVKQEPDWDRGTTNEKQHSKASQQGDTGKQDGKGKGCGKGERNAESNNECSVLTDTDKVVWSGPQQKKLKINRQQYVDHIVNLDYAPTYYPNALPNIVQAFLINMTHDQGTLADPEESMDQVLCDVVRYPENHPFSSDMLAGYGFMGAECSRHFAWLY
jgi:hypothetical protein